MTSETSGGRAQTSRSSLEDLRYLAALRQRLRDALVEVSPTLIWFAKQQELGGMPANIWKNLDRLPSPRMQGLSPAFDLTNTLQRLERTLRQFNTTQAEEVCTWLTNLTTNLKETIENSKGHDESAAGLVRLLTDDRIGTFTMESAARALRCGTFPIRIPALPSYIAGHVVFSELRRVKVQLEQSGNSPTAKRAPSVASVAQGVGAMRSFIRMVRSRSEVCAAIAADLGEIRDLRALVDRHRPVESDAAELKDALDAQERFILTRLGGNLRRAGVLILGLREAFRQAATAAKDASENKRSDKAGRLEVGSLFAGDARIYTKTAHDAGRRRADQFVRRYLRQLNRIGDLGSGSRAKKAYATKRLDALDRLHPDDRNSWVPTIAHTARARMLREAIKNRSRVKSLFDFAHNNGKANGRSASVRLSAALKSAWDLQRSTFIDSAPPQSWIEQRYAVFKVAEKLAANLRGATKARGAKRDAAIIEAFETAAAKYAEHSDSIERKLVGETRWATSFVERMLFGCLTGAPDRSDPLDLLSALSICDRMGDAWSEPLEDRAVAAIADLQRVDGGFEAGRPPVKWVHGFVMLAPSAATIAVLGSFLNDPEHSSKSTHLGRAAYERRLTRWEAISIRAIEYLLSSRIGTYKKNRELSGWHSDRQPEDGRIDLLTTSIAVRALAEMHDVLSKLINRRAFEGLQVSYPEPKARKSLFVFDCKSKDPGRHELPVLVNAQRAAEWLRYHTRGFPEPEDFPPKEYKPRTTLYYGPPGTGKTFASEIIAGELQWPLVVINPHQFLSEGEQFVGKVAAEIFERLQFASNCCIIFDEFDQLIIDRNAQTMPSPFAMVTATMLPLLADLHERAVKENCLVAFVTNYRALLDAAAIRHGRIDQQSCVVYPDYGSRYLYILRSQTARKERVSRQLVRRFARATGMRAVSDLIKVAKTPKKEARSRQSFPSPALGPAHYRDMLKKLQTIEEHPTGLTLEFQRFETSLGVRLSSPSGDKDLALQNEEYQDWGIVAQRVPRPKPLAGGTGDAGAGTR